MDNRKPFVSQTEIAERLGISVRSVYEMLRGGKLPVDDQGKVPRSAFEALQARLRASMQSNPNNAKAPEDKSSAFESRPLSLWKREAL